MHLNLTQTSDGDKNFRRTLLRIGNPCQISLAVTSATSISKGYFSKSPFNVTHCPERISLLMQISKDTMGLNTGRHSAARQDGCVSTGRTVELYCYDRQFMDPVHPGATNTIVMVCLLGMEQLAEKINVTLL